MREQTVVLRNPFNIDTHKKTFINYLEVIIAADGTIMYAVPSHQEKLIALACERLEVTRNQLSDLCPKEYYGDFVEWLCKITDCVSLWNDFMAGVANHNQKRSIMQLTKENLYHGPIFVANEELH